MAENILISIVMGLGLSAACGFRIFVPMLVICLASRTGHLTLAESWAWLASDPALIVLATATVLEIGGYYIPIVDHFLDIVATPAAVIAGTVVSAAVFVDMTPLMKWTLAVIAGGGAATATHATMATARAFVAGTTGGLGNWVVNTGEIVVSAGVSFLTLLLPVLCVALLVLVIVATVIAYKRWRRMNGSAGMPVSA